MNSQLAHTPLTDWHAAHGGRMVDFAGWLMPVQYTSIVAEHTATRSAVGLFDVSHMGRFRIEGPDARTFLDRVVTRRVTDLKPGQIRYALATNEAGGILDDVLVYHLAAAEGASTFQLVVNASNRQKIWDHLEAHRAGANVSLADVTRETAMIAVQGPRALEIARPLAEVDAARLRYYNGAITKVSGGTGVISRTGYTGEDGCELIVPAAAALEVWDKLASAAAQFGGLPAGLGARDTLRLEAGMPLYGHELTEAINPFQAGLGYAVDLENRAFIGRDALVKLYDNSRLPRRAGWIVSSKRVPREGYEVLAGDTPVGQVTSGTFAPTLEVPIAMGYIRPDLAAAGTSVTIDIRGQRELARSVQLPFYQRSS
ncbi:MAG: glycine cleavage system aminomethyltransferase GcvT [Pirellulales bacterium]